MVLFVIGYIEPKQVFDLVEKDENTKTLRPQADIERVYPPEPTTISEFSRTAYLDVVEPLFLMGFKDTDVGYDGLRLLKKEISTGILLEIILGRSSKTYEKLYKEGLVDDRFSFGYQGQKGYGFCTIGGETRDPDSLHNKLVESISKYIREGIQVEDFVRIKKKYIGEFIQNCNLLEFVTTSFVSYYHKNINIFDYIKYYRKYP